MTGHGGVWIWEWGACSAFGSWDTQCGIYGVLYYWNFFIPDDIRYHWLYNPYSYDALKMGNFHFCNSWGGSWFYGFEPLFCEDFTRTHSSAFMGFSDVGYTSVNFAREWSEKWLYWDYDSWTAYSDSLWAQDHQWEYPLWYSDYIDVIYA